MQYVKRLGACFSLLILPLLLAFTMLAGVALAGSAASQSSCDSGDSFIYSWSSMGIARPQIASMSVDGETIADPVNPADGSIGATICAGTAKGARTGLSIYYHHMDGDTDLNDLDLTNALTPAGHPITASSRITIAMTNMGDLAKYFSFALVHGLVSTWTTANLGTSSASLTVTLSPVRTPAGTGDDFGLCTATPPTCNAAKSDSDYLGAGLDMSFDQRGDSTFNGAYFGLVSAMGGFVQAVSNSDGTKSLVATLGAPHLLADGVTPNVGSLSAFLPSTVLESLFGLPAGGVDTSTLAVTRTDSSSTSDAPFTVTPVTGGVIVKLSNITFSTPIYTIKKAAATTTTTPSTSGSSSTAKKADTTTTKAVIDTTKTYIRLDGKNVMADDRQTFAIVVGLEDASGKPITDRKPTIVMSGGQSTLHPSILIGNEWITEVSASVPGEIKAAISADTIDLGSLNLLFVAVPQVVTAKPVAKTITTIPEPAAPSPLSSPVSKLVVGLGILTALGLAIKFRTILLGLLHRRIF